ncbi:MAG: FAD-dependent oxidoreductase [Thiohalomonadaceae bacterium]
MSKHADVQVDIVICGGGVAGLWLLARLRQQGYQAILIELSKLGSGQTRYAQGIIHGGTKYALTGAVSGSSEAIAAMPALWRDCLAGSGEIDLRAAKLLSRHQYLWSTAGLTSRMAGFFASKLMRSRIEPLTSSDYPAVFRHEQFLGQVYSLEEPVLDTASLLHALAQPHENFIWHAQVRQIDGLCLSLVNGDRQINISTKQIVLTAGRGNAGLLRLLGRDTPRMQTRPLKMVMLRGDLPTGVYAHCLGASSNPRITISSHTDIHGRSVWYLGGELADAGVMRSDAEQLSAARKELSELLPWLDINGCDFAVLDIDRAEPQMSGGRRPDDVYVEQHDGVITAWPTKLAFAPRLAMRVLELLQQAQINPAAANELPNWDFPGYALLPWQEEERWS